MATPNRKRQTAGGPSKGKAKAARAKLKVVRAPEEQANPESELIARWAEQAPTAVLICRKYGHKFPDDQLLRLYRINLNYSVRELECERCHSLRRDVIENHSLSAVKRRYEYVQGYQRDQGADGKQRLPRWAVAEAIESHIDYLAPPEHIADLFKNVRL